MLENLKSFDAYPKTLEDFRIKTLCGGAVTVMSSLVMILLFLSELKDYYNGDLSEDLFVDITRFNKLTIDFDCYFPAVPCDFISLDLVDTSGQQHRSVAHSIYKLKLDQAGNPLEEPEKQEKIGTKNMTQEALELEPKRKDISVPDNSKCGSCYGAESDEKRCCNSCLEVRQAYGFKGWELPHDISVFEQCKGMETKKMDEGCQIYGKLKVGRIGGVFHIAPGISFDKGHFHIHDLKPYSAKDFNMSHVFNEFTFGDRIEAIIPPLQNFKEISQQGGMMYKYYLKIVPTKYIHFDGTIKHSYQYSVTRHEKKVPDDDFTQELPGIYVQYELSPMMVVYTEKRKSFGQFATSVCAIIGGIFTVAKIFDSFLYSSSKLLEKKLEIGKAF